jgi:ParB-like chromosome segregation protein Spo0J
MRSRPSGNGAGEGSAMTIPRELSAHQLSTLFDPMEGEKLDILGADIKANRLREPIWLFEDKILDGNSRYRACIKIAYPLKETDFRQFDPKTQGDPLAFIVSANLHRRHLTESQRAAIAAKLVTSKVGINQYNGASVTNKRAAELLGVSEATVKMAKDVAKNAAPEIAERVQKGELRLAAAKQLVKLPKEQQVAELAKKNAEKEKEKEARTKAKGTSTKGIAKANQEMTDLDDFKKKWQSFNEMQRRGFVMTFEDQLAGILDFVRQQKALIGVQKEEATADAA